MRRFLLSVLIALFVSNIHAQGTVEDRIDRFQHWADCQPIGLLFEDLPVGATLIGLTKESIQTLFRNRLHAAWI